MGYVDGLTGDPGTPGVAGLSGSVQIDPSATGLTSASAAVGEAPGITFSAAPTPPVPPSPVAPDEPVVAAFTG